RSEYLSDQKTASVGSLWRNAARIRIRFPKLVGGHSLASHCMTFDQIMRQDAERFRNNKRNAMTRQQIVKHLHVLPGDGRAKHGKDAGGQTKIDGQTVYVPGARTSAGSQNHFMLAQIGYDFVY